MPDWLYFVGACVGLTAPLWLFGLALLIAS